jgi:hypothetical protein
MNKRLQGSLIQRPNEAPSITPPPKTERFWNVEHFGNISTVDDKIAVAKKTGQVAKDVATSDEAKQVGTGFAKILLEGLKILSSSAGGIAIYNGILLILERKLIEKSDGLETLFKTTKFAFVISLLFALFGGFIVSQLMVVKNKAGVIAEDENVQAGLAEAENTAADAEMEAAIAAATVDEASSAL